MPYLHLPIVTLALPQLSTRGKHPDYGFVALTCMATSTASDSGHDSQQTETVTMTISFTPCALRGPFPKGGAQCPLLAGVIPSSQTFSEPPY